MSKERALLICYNLDQTIRKMTDRTHTIHKNKTYEVPRARRSKLIALRDKLLKKHNLTL